MDNKKVLILIILCIFLVGMLMSPITAIHTLKKGKYKVKVSNRTYNKIKKGKISFTKKVGVKKKTKWKTKKMKTYESWIDSNGNLIKSKSWSPYNKWGYKIKYVKSVWEYYSDGDICWDYYKVPKTVKKPIYLHAYGDSTGGKDKPHYTGKVKVYVDGRKEMIL